MSDLPPSGNLGSTMACVTVLPAIQKHLVATSGTDCVEYFSDWMPAIAMDAATAALKLRNVTGYFRATVVVQTAEVRTDIPNTPTLIGAITGQTVDGETFFSAATFDLATLTTGQTYVRFGVAYDVSTTPSFGQADVTLQVAFRQCGSLGKAWSGQLVARSSDACFVPIGAWQPAMGVVKLEGTIAISGLTGAFELSLAYRTAATSIESPDAWITTGMGSALTTADETNTGELTPTTTGKMWIQPGLKYDLASGTFGQADVTVLLGIRSSS